MKKVFVLMLGIVLTFSVMAQNLSGDFKINQIDRQAKLFDGQLPVNPKTSTLLTPGDLHEEWINFGYFLCEATVGNAATNYKVYSGILFPDTFVLVRYTDPINGGFVYDNVNWCSVGSILDPTSSVLRIGFGDKKVVKPYASYKVDSIEIPFWYYRYSDPSVVDTLVIQMYKPANISGYTYLPSAGDKAGKKAFAVTKYSRSKKEGAMADWVKRIPLTSADTTSHIAVIKEAIPNFTIPNGGSVGITWTFKSGSPYKYLDTIPLAKWDSVQGVSYPQNAFFWAYYADQSQLELFEWNNGVCINTQQRYSDLTFPPYPTSFPSTYLSFSQWKYPVYPYVLMKISWTETIGINDLAKDVKVELYPSPATTTQDINLDMTLDSKKNISIDVYDLLGHKVSSVTNGTYNSGKHSFSISTSNLTSGMYICNIVANGAVKTMKFEVR
jgi:hypothetical protein